MNQRHEHLCLVTGATRDWGGTGFGNRLVDSRERFVPASPEPAEPPQQLRLSAEMKLPGHGDL